MHTSVRKCNQVFVSQFTDSDLHTHYKRTKQKQKPQNIRDIGVMVQVVHTCLHKAPGPTSDVTLKDVR